MRYEDGETHRHSFTFDGLGNQYTSIDETVFATWFDLLEDTGARQVVFGQLDNEPIVLTDLRLGMDLAVSYDNIREHMKPSSVNR